MKKVIVSGAVVALGTLSTGVAADEVVENNQATPVEQAVSEQKTASSLATQHEVAVKEVVDVRAAVEKQQKVVDTVMSEVSQTESEVKQTQGILEQAQKFAEQATDEVIADKKAGLEEQTKTLAEVKTEKPAVEVKVADAQQKVNAQASNVEAAQHLRNEEAKDVKEAEQAVREAESAFDSKSIIEAQQAVTDLNVKVHTTTQEVAQLQVDIKKVQDANANLVAAGDRRRKELEQALKDAGPEYLTKIVEHVVREGKVSESDMKDTPHDPFFVRDGVTYYTPTNEDVVFDGEEVEVIQLDSKEMEYKEVDYELVSQYFRDYLEQLRTINGIDIPVPDVTEEALAWANARTQEMAENDELSHDTELDLEDFGLADETENASYKSLHGRSSLSEKEIAYTELLQYFNDYSNASVYGSTDPKQAAVSNYGQRRPLLAASGDGFAIGHSEGYGILTFVSKENNQVYGDTVSKETGNLVWAYSLAKAVNEDDDPVKSEFYFDGQRVKFLPKTTFKYVWEEEVTYKNEKFEAASKALADFKRDQAAKEATNQQNLAELTSALTRKEDQLRQESQSLATAKERLEFLTGDNEAKLLVLEKAQAALKVQQDELAQAEELVTQEKAGLDRLVEKRDAAVAELSELERHIKELGATVAGAEQEIAQLEKAPELVEEAKVQLEKAEAALKAAVARLEVEMVTLDELRELLSHKQEEVAKIEESIRKLEEEKRSKQESGRFEGLHYTPRPSHRSTTVKGSKGKVAQHVSLPNTGQESDELAMAAAGFLAMLGSISVKKRKRS